MSHNLYRYEYYLSFCRYWWRWRSMKPRRKTWLSWILTGSLKRHLVGSGSKSSYPLLVCFLGRAHTNLGIPKNLAVNSTISWIIPGSGIRVVACPGSQIALYFIKVVLIPSLPAIKCKTSCFPPFSGLALTGQWAMIRISQPELCLCNGDINP